MLSAVELGGGAGDVQEGAEWCEAMSVVKE